ncbi:hypothetical protein FHG87_018983, partial [Trinorchestia longiramus]
MPPRPGDEYLVQEVRGAPDRDAAGAGHEGRCPCVALQSPCNTSAPSCRRSCRWDCMVSRILDVVFRDGTGKLHIIEGTVNVAIYHNIPNDNFLVPVTDLNLLGGWTFQQDNDPNHTHRELRAVEDHCTPVMQLCSVLGCEHLHVHLILLVRVLKPGITFICGHAKFGVTLISATPPGEHAAVPSSVLM